MTGPIPTLPPQAVKLIRLYSSSTFEGERDNARRMAEAILPPEAGGFDRALRIQAYHDVKAEAGSFCFMTGFAEFCEIDDPGYMARQATARAETKRKQDDHRARLIEQYGSLDAVLKPCDREMALRRALKPWRVPGKRPHQRWTWELKGWDYSDVVSKMPPEMRAAVEGALPMPTTFADAQAELAHWRSRDDDLRIALDHYGDYGLDRVCIARMDIIREIVESGMRLHTLPEILARFKIYRDRENLDERDLEEAVYRDLVALAEREARA